MELELNLYIFFFFVMESNYFHNIYYMKEIYYSYCLIYARPTCVFIVDLYVMNAALFLVSVSRTVTCRYCTTLFCAHEFLFVFVWLVAFG